MIDADGPFAQHFTMTTKARNRLITFSIIAAPFVFLICLLLYWETQPPPASPLPNPNGYDDLMKAGNMITGHVWTYDEANVGELREMALTNATALALARIGLSNQCAVTLQFSPAYASNRIQDFVGLRKLAQTFTVEGRLAEKENRYADAAKSYLDVVHLANQIRCGGVVIDAMMGMAMEALGVKHLQQLLDRLNAKSCRETAAALEMLDSQRPTWDAIVQQEREWSRRTFPGFRYALTRLMERKSSKKILQNAEQNYENQQSQTRQLIVELAARAYELDKGHRPAQLADLVPDYLKRIPPDPSRAMNQANQ